MAVRRCHQLLCDIHGAPESCETATAGALRSPVQSNLRPGKRQHVSVPRDTSSVAIVGVLFACNRCEKCCLSLGLGGGRELTDGRVTSAQPMQLDNMGYIMEFMWGRVFGEPWVMPRQNFTRIFPQPWQNPDRTAWPSPSHTPSHSATPAPTESQQPFPRNAANTSERSPLAAAEM